MSQIIIAPNEDKSIFPVSVFLAGGITNCENWQEKVLRELECENITIFNPRRTSFNIADKNASVQQITWEYNCLEKMDVFSMYFCNGESDQPICMYELGRNILRMQNRFPSDWEKRIVVGIESGYKRKQDVIVQMDLCAPNLFIESDTTPELHAQYIKKCVRKFL